MGALCNGRICGPFIWLEAGQSSKILNYAFCVLLKYRCCKQTYPEGYFVTAESFRPGARIKQILDFIPIRLSFRL